jgi:uncharacterized membrane protein YbjE (DUF340 family)
MEPVVVVIAAAAVALFAIEFWYIGHHEQTISERMQRTNARMGIQLLSFIFFLLGVAAGWFIGHFTSPPPGG